MSTAPPVVEMRKVSISFPGVKALDEVDFRLFPGEVHSLMGENGAGKSTLIKALTGVYQIDSGSILVDGAERAFHGPHDAQQASISTVYQEVNLCPNLSIGENVMLGHEVRGAMGVNWRKTHRRASKALAAMGLRDLDPHQPLASIPIAVQQLVAISRAMVTDAKVLILDEPTSSLDASEVETLFDVLRDLRDKGVAILFVTHFLEQVYAISDRITVLRNGSQVGEHAVRDLDRGRLVSLMIGRDLEVFDSISRTATSLDQQKADAEVLLEARQVGRRGSVAPTDLRVDKGEILGFAGLLGSGRTELARLLYGADKHDSGEVTMHGRSVSLSSPVSGLGNRIAFSTENRRDEGIVADLSVRENLVLALQARRGWARPLPKQERDEIVERLMTTLGVRPADPDRPIKDLSGGNQQKVLLARWLATGPELLILDEPTRGIDVGAKAEIQSIVLHLAESGTAVVFISSELGEVVRLSGRIVVMKDRRKVAEVAVGPELTAQSIVDIIAAEDGLDEDDHDQVRA